MNWSMRIYASSSENPNWMSNLPSASSESNVSSEDLDDDDDDDDDDSDCKGLGDFELVAARGV